MEQLVWMFGGAARGANVTGGAPFVLVGAPGDYVFGGEGEKAPVTFSFPGDNGHVKPEVDITMLNIDDRTACNVYAQCVDKMSNSPFNEYLVVFLL